MSNGKRTASKQLIAGTLAGVLFVSNVVLAHALETNFWTQRSQSIQMRSATSNVIPAKAGIPSLRSPLKTRGDDETLPVLSQFGSVRGITNDGDGRTVIHIQDVHLNEEAQTNIGKMVEALVNQEKVDLVALEGAFGELDLKPFQSFPSTDIKKSITDYLFRTQKISGAVRTLLTTSSTPKIIGVDHETHYKANVNAYLESAKEQKRISEELSSLSTQLSQQKRNVFNAKLFTFDQTVEKYRKGEIGLGDYLRTAFLVPRSSDENIKNFKEAYKLETSLDFNQVEHQRTRLLDKLVKKLGKSDVNNLMAASVSFRMGKTTPSDFYGFLKKLCDINHISLDTYPAMKDYLRYIVLSDSINAEALFAEVKELEEKAYETLVKSDAEHELVQEARHLYLTQQLVEFALTPEEWREYHDNYAENLQNEAASPLGGEGRVRGVSHPFRFINKKTTTDPSPDLSPKGRGNYVLASFENFYREAEARDTAMSENLLHAMEKHDAKVTVLVTGGFHSYGINPRMKEAGITVTSVVPRITKIDTEAGSSYLSVFAQQKTPLDKLFAGEKLFVTPRVIPVLSSLKKLFITAGTGLIKRGTREWQTLKRFGREVWTATGTGASIQDVRVTVSAVSLTAITSASILAAFGYLPQAPALLILAAGLLGLIMAATHSPQLAFEGLYFSTANGSNGKPKRRLPAIASPPSTPRLDPSQVNGNGHIEEGTYFTLDDLKEEFRTDNHVQVILGQIEENIERHPRKRRKVDDFIREWEEDSDLWSARKRLQDAYYGRLGENQQLLFEQNHFEAFMKVRFADLFSEFSEDSPEHAFVRGLTGFRNASIAKVRSFRRLLAEKRDMAFTALNVKEALEALGQGKRIEFHLKRAKRAFLDTLYHIFPWILWIGYLGTLLASHLLGHFDLASYPYAAMVPPPLSFDGGREVTADEFLEEFNFGSPERELLQRMLYSLSEEGRAENKDGVQIIRQEIINGIRKGGTRNIFWKIQRAIERVPKNGDDFDTDMKRVIRHFFVKGPLKVKDLIHRTRGLEYESLQQVLYLHWEELELLSRMKAATHSTHDRERNVEKLRGDIKWNKKWQKERETILAAYNTLYDEMFVPVVSDDVAVIYDEFLDRAQSNHLGINSFAKQFKDETAERILIIRFLGALKTGRQYGQEVSYNPVLSIRKDIVNNAQERQAAEVLAKRLDGYKEEDMEADLRQFKLYLLTPGLPETLDPLHPVQGITMFAMKQFLFWDWEAISLLEEMEGAVWSSSIQAFEAYIEGDSKRKSARDRIGAAFDYFTGAGMTKNVGKIWTAFFDKDAFGDGLDQDSTGPPNKKSRTIYSIDLFTGFIVSVVVIIAFVIPWIFTLIKRKISRTAPEGFLDAAVAQAGINFGISDELLENISNEFTRQLQATLAWEEENATADSFEDKVELGRKRKEFIKKRTESSLALHPTYDRPITGIEEGTVVTFDWGGTNGRLRLVEIANNTFTTLKETEFDISSFKQDPAIIFKRMAAHIKELLDGDTEKPYRLASTFAFPLLNLSVEMAFLDQWTKEWKDGPSGKIEGTVVNEHILTALKEEGFNNISLEAVANDTKNPRAAFNYEKKYDGPEARDLSDVYTVVYQGRHLKNTYVGTTPGEEGDGKFWFNLALLPDAEAGGIVGTGVNDEGDFGPSIGARNFESGDFNLGPYIKEVTTKEDEAIAPRDPPYEHLGEKRISGVALGELLRLRIRNLARKQTKYFQWLHLPAFSEENGLESTVVSKIYADNSDGLTDTKKLLKTLGVKRSSVEEREVLQSLAILISHRSIKLVAAQYVGRIRLNDPAIEKQHVIAIEGGIFNSFPGYAINVWREVENLVGTQKANRITLVGVKNREGMGIALLAAPSQPDTSGFWSMLFPISPTNSVKYVGWWLETVLTVTVFLLLKENIQWPALHPVVVPLISAFLALLFYTLILHMSRLHRFRDNTFIQKHGSLVEAHGFYRHMIWNYPNWNYPAAPQIRTLRHFLSVTGKLMVSGAAYFGPLFVVYSLASVVQANLFNLLLAISLAWALFFHLYRSTRFFDIGKEILSQLAIGLVSFAALFYGIQNYFKPVIPNNPPNITQEEKDQALMNRLAKKEKWSDDDYEQAEAFLNRFDGNQLLRMNRPFALKFFDEVTKRVALRVSKKKEWTKQDERGAKDFIRAHFVDPILSEKVLFDLLEKTLTIHIKKWEALKAKGQLNDQNKPQDILVFDFRDKYQTLLLRSYKGRLLIWIGGMHGEKPTIQVSKFVAERLMEKNRDRAQIVIEQIIGHADNKTIPLGEFTGEWKVLHEKQRELGLPLAIANGGQSRLAFETLLRKDRRLKDQLLAAHFFLFFKTLLREDVNERASENILQSFQAAVVIMANEFGLSYEEAATSVLNFVRRTRDNASITKFTTYTQKVSADSTVIANKSIDVLLIRL